MIRIEWADLAKGAIVGAIALAAIVTQPALESAIEAATTRKKDRQGSE